MTGAFNVQIVRIQNGWIMTIQTQVSAATIFFTTFPGVMDYLRRINPERIEEKPGN